MEVYNEVLNRGNFNVEFSVRNLFNHNVPQFNVYCIARNPEGRLLWEKPVTDASGETKCYQSVEEGLQEAKTAFQQVSSEEDEFEALANQQIDDSLYFLSLI
jgi:hypothetical protein